MKISRAALVAGLGTALALLAIAVWLEWRQAARTDETAAWVALSHEVQAELDRLLALTADIGPGEHSFLITGDPAFLAPFESGVTAITQQQRELEQRIRDDQMKAGLSALEPLIAERIASARRNVELRRTLGFEAARQAVAAGEGMGATDRIRSQFARMAARQRTLLAERTARAQREAGRARWLVALGVSLSGALLLSAFAVVLRENRVRRQSEHELDRFFTLSLDLLAIAGADGYFKRLNPAFGQVLGYSTDELLARPFLDFVHPDDRAATLTEVEKLGRGEPTGSFENRYRHQDGSWRWLSWRSAADPGGLIYASALDTTERKEAEATIAQLNAESRDRTTQLEAANQELESFAYSVSHDLRAPLRGMDGFSQALLEDYAGRLDATGQDYLRRIRAAAQRMGQLIDDLLGLSQVTRSEIAMDQVDLTALAHRVIAELQPQQAGRAVQWQVGDQLTGRGDPRLLQLLLENLLGNALKFTGKCEHARIEIGQLIQAGEPVFFVGDNGAGFDMAHANRLFGAFQRLHSSHEFPGTGIGLATVQRIIHRHGGRVWAEAQPAQGATFHFTLPTSA